MWENFQKVSMFCSFTSHPVIKEKKNNAVIYFLKQPLKDKRLQKHNVTGEEVIQSHIPFFFFS